MKKYEIFTGDWVVQNQISNGIFDFEGVKKFFEPDREKEDEEYWIVSHEKWKAIKDIWELEDFLKERDHGMAPTWRIEEV